MTFLSLVFNKTPVITQRLSPPIFGKKLVTFQKTHISQLSIFASSFLCFFLFFMFFGVCFKKHLFHPTVGPLGLSLRPNLATARASEGQFPACFPCFWLFSLFDLFDGFPSCLASPLVKNGIQKLPFARRWLPGGPRMPTNDTRTTQIMNSKIILKSYTKSVWWQNGTKNQNGINTGTTFGPCWCLLAPFPFHFISFWHPLGMICS